jgi:NAD(P)-dependent dehydrogenase (short-subunit alcohol dehydrogenase family)
MQGKVCLITGATAGIGKATAQGLAAKGATLIITGRNRDKTAVTAAELKAASGNSNIDFLVADLSSQAEVRRLADEFKQKYSRLDVLINNAGGVFTKRQTTVDGLEYTFALNHLAPFLLTNLLLDLLKASAPARVITVSSGAEQGGRLDFDDLQSEKSYSAFRVYSTSKLENILFSNELARRLKGTGVTSNSLHPGFVASDFGKNNPGLLSMAMVLVRPFAINVEKGAATSIYLASSPEVEGVTGKFFTKSAEATPSNPMANNEAAARRLWEISEKLCHLVPA